MKSSKLIEIRVRLTPEQLVRFKEGAESQGCEPGDIMLALACDRLGMGDEYPADIYTKALLWRFVSRRQSPGMANYWGDAGFWTQQEADELGNEQADAHAEKLNRSQADELRRKMGGSSHAA